MSSGNIEKITGKRKKRFRLWVSIQDCGKKIKRKRKVTLFEL